MQLSDDELREVLTRAEEIQRSSRSVDNMQAEMEAVIGAGELGYSPERLAVSVQGVAEALQLIFRRARAEGLPTAEVADRIAEERVAAAAHLRAMAPGTGAMRRA